MAIVGAFDVHRRQLTFDWVDEASGETQQGRIVPACRQGLRDWLAQFAGRSDVCWAVEACTGWRYVIDELHRAGIAAHLAEPADTAAMRGPKRRAKTDRTDARLLRQLLADGRLPESWIPPEQVLETRATLELYKDLADEHTAWVQRIHATVFHHGAPAVDGRLSDPQVRARLAIGGGLSEAGAQAVRVALRMLDTLETELDPLHRQITRFANTQPACRELQKRLYGVGPITAAAIWAFLGDTRRFSASRKAVRHTGLDITVYSSDGKRGHGHLSRQGPPLLRWALFEAAQNSAHRSAPDYRYYTKVRTRIDANRAALAVARTITRRAHHILRDLGDTAFAA
jgi:transposase